MNKVDPLGITSLRIRGMWILQNPWKTFNYLTSLNSKKKFEFCAVINAEKYNSFPEHLRLEEMAKTKEGLELTDVKIKCPDNPAKLINAKLIRFTIE